MNTVINKKTILVLSLLLFAFNVIAQTEELNRPDTSNLSRNIILEAQLAFDNKDYPAAFKLTQEAKDTRRSESVYVVSTLQAALRKPSAQEVGKDIEQLINYFTRRQEHEIIGIINYVLADYSIEYFDYSIENVVSHLEEGRNFPEADFLLGKLYVIEGELEVAESFFISAYKNRILLDIDGVQFDILYEMAELYRIQGKYNAYEEVLLLIAIEDENYFQNGKSSPFLHSVKSALKSDMDTDKFYLLFRDDYYPALDAWYYLTKYYLEQQQNEKALETAILHTLVTLTRVDEVLKNRDINYTYTTLDDFFVLLKQFTDISDWAIEKNMWEGFYLLANISYQNGNVEFAKAIFSALVVHSPQRQWRILSEKALNQI